MNKYKNYENYSNNNNYNYNRYPTTFNNNSNNIGHHLKLSCLQKCSNWILFINICEHNLNKSNTVYGKSFCGIINSNADLFNSLAESYPNFDSLVKDFHSSCLLNTIKKDDDVEIFLPNSNFSKNGNFLKFFLEFDLNNSKERGLKSINILPDFMNQSIDFSINNIVHGNKMFNRDLLIKIDGFKIVKSIQNKLEQIKNLMYKNKNFKLKNNEIFVKLVTFDKSSFGISFFLPNSINLERFYPSINNVLNAHLIIKKLYLEIQTNENGIQLGTTNLTTTTATTLETNEEDINIQNTHKDFNYSGGHRQHNHHFTKQRPFFNGRPGNFNHYVQGSHNNPIYFHNQRNIPMYKPSKFELDYHNMKASEFASKIREMDTSKIKPFIPKSQMNQMPFDINKQIEPNVTENEDKKEDNALICNFNVFMTGVTPLVYECPELTIKDFFKAFERISAFGLTCLFTSQKDGKLSSSGSSIAPVTYYPTLVALNIDQTYDLPYNRDKDNLSTASSASRNLFDDYRRRDNFPRTTERLYDNSTNTSIDDSFSLSLLSFGDDLYNNSNNNERNKELIHQRKGSINSVIGTYNRVSFVEDKPLHQRLTLTERLTELSTEYNLDKLTLDEIAVSSFFILLWTPFKSTNNVTFLIIYKFRGKQISNTVKFLKIIGIFTNKIDDDSYWFTNQNMIENPLTYSKALYEQHLNRQNFLKHNESFHQFMYDHKLNGCLDYINMIR